MKYPSDRHRGGRRREGVYQPGDGLPAVAKTPRLPSQKEAGARPATPDPLADIFDAEIVPLLKAAPGMRPVAHLRGDAAASSRARRRHPAHAGAAHPRVAGGSRRGAGGHLPADARARPDRACPTSPTWPISASRSPACRSIIGSITSGSPGRGFEHAHVILGGESFVALAEGLQNALWSLGGAPSRASQRQPVGRLPQSRRRRPGRSDAALRGPVRPLRHDADPQQSPASRMRTARSRARTVTSRRRRRCAADARHARLRRSCRLPRASSTRSSAAATRRNAKRIDAERPPPAAAARPAHQRLRGDDRHASPPPAASRCARCSTPCPPA